MIRGILINPWGFLVRSVLIDENDVTSVYRTLTPAFLAEHPVIGASVAQVYPNGDNLLIDSDAVNKPKQRHFHLGMNRFAGCGLLLGSKDGEFVPSAFEVSEIQDRVRFL